MKFKSQVIVATGDEDDNSQLKLIRFWNSEKLSNNVFLWQKLVDQNFECVKEKTRKRGEMVGWENLHIYLQTD